MEAASSETRLGERDVAFSADILVVKAERGGDSVDCSEIEVL